MALFMKITGLAFAIAVSGAVSVAASAAVAPLPASGQEAAKPKRVEGQMVAQNAADCRAAAARVVAEIGGQLLSVRESGGECVIIVLVPGNGSERPRKVTMRVAG
ncbi:hypothetical protein [Rhizobium sp. SL42]|uniref:hypothetical protein n=1 Tax=Rhizobium sp. SL42 TaxID=2806346 RepID=UPI001F252A6D|nr:hypothetical protein [Rhizobium sp. SL42]UJW76560.1 hypothetical protein IM739_08900 [Rhizobium sp. SL42]